MRGIALTIAMAAVGSMAMGQSPSPSRDYPVRGLALSAELSGVDFTAGTLSRNAGTAAGPGSFGRDGVGFSLGVRYGVTSRLAAIVDVSPGGVSAGATASPLVDSWWSVDHVELGVRQHWPLAGRRWVPFGDVAYSALFLERSLAGLGLGATASDSGSLAVSGSGIRVGGGVLAFLGDRWAMSGNAAWTTGRLRSIDTCRGAPSCRGLVPQRYRTLRVGLGITWFPIRRAP